MYMKESMSHLSWTAIRKTYSSPEDGFTWKQELPWPTPSVIIRNVVRACVIRLRGIGDVDSPERLVYKEAYSQTACRSVKSLVRVRQRTVVNKPQGVDLSRLS